MNEPTITPELVQKHSLTPEEYEKLKAILGREPSGDTVLRDGDIVVIYGQPEELERAESVLLAG